MEEYRRQCALNPELMKIATTLVFMPEAQRQQVLARLNSTERTDQQIEDQHQRIWASMTAKPWIPLSLEREGQPLTTTIGGTTVQPRQQHSSDERKRQKEQQDRPPSGGHSRNRPFNNGESLKKPREQPDLDNPKVQPAPGFMWCDHHHWNRTHTSGTCRSRNNGTTKRENINKNNNVSKYNDSHDQTNAHWMDSLSISRIQSLFVNSDQLDPIVHSNNQCSQHTSLDAQNSSSDASLMKSIEDSVADSTPCDKLDDIYQPLIRQRFPLKQSEFSATFIWLHIDSRTTIRLVEGF